MATEIQHEEFRLPRTLSIIWVVVAGVLAILVSVGWLIGTPAFDGRQIFGEYANQLRVGHGLVFNPGQFVLLVPSPAYLLLLGIVGAVIPFYMQDIAWLLHLIALAIGAVSLFRIARRAALSQVLAGLVATLYILAWPVGAGIQTPYPIAAALCLLAFDLALSSRWQLAGFVLSVAVLSSPEAALLAIVLFMFAVNNKAGWRYGLFLIIPLILVLFVLRLYYGPSLWAGLLIFKFSKPFDLPIFEVLSLPLSGLALWGWYRQRANSIVAVCGTWIMLYLVLVSVLLRTSVSYHFALIAGPLTLLAVIGVSEIRFRKTITYALVTVLYLFLAFMGSMVIHDYFGPFLSSVQEFKSIGVPSASTASKLRSSADQVFIALDGQLQPEVKAMLERGDIPSILVRYAPDALVINNLGKAEADELVAKWATRLNYKPADEDGLYKRTVPIGEFVDQPASIPYGPDIRLVGLALDQQTLKPGQLLRVRLDWEVARPASRPVIVDLQLTADNKALAQANDEFSPLVFRAGRWSTYHTVTLADDAQPGPLALQVGVSVNNGTIARVPVATLNVVAR